MDKSFDDWVKEVEFHGWAGDVKAFAEGGAVMASPTSTIKVLSYGPDDELQEVEVPGNVDTNAYFKDVLEPQGFRQAGVKGALHNTGRIIGGFAEDVLNAPLDLGGALGAGYDYLTGSDRGEQEDLYERFDFVDEPVGQSANAADSFVELAGIPVPVVAINKAAKILPGVADMIVDATPADAIGIARAIKDGDLEFLQSFNNAENAKSLGAARGPKAKTDRTPFIINPETGEITTGIAGTTTDLTEIYGVVPTALKGKRHGKTVDGATITMSAEAAAEQSAKIKARVEKKAAADLKISRFPDDRLLGVEEFRGKTWVPGKGYIKATDGDPFSGKAYLPKDTSPEFRQTLLDTVDDITLEHYNDLVRKSPEEIGTKGIDIDDEELDWLNERFNEQALSDVEDEWLNSQHRNSKDKEKSKEYFAWQAEKRRKLLNPDEKTLTEEIKVKDSLEFATKVSDEAFPDIYAALQPLIKDLPLNQQNRILHFAKVKSREVFDKEKFIKGSAGMNMAKEKADRAGEHVYHPSWNVYEGVKTRTGQGGWGGMTPREAVSTNQQKEFILRTGPSQRLALPEENAPWFNYNPEEMAVLAKSFEEMTNNLRKHQAHISQYDTVKLIKSMDANGFDVRTLNFDGLTDPKDFQPYPMLKSVLQGKKKNDPDDIVLYDSLDEFIKKNDYEANAYPFLKQITQKDIDDGTAVDKFVKFKRDSYIQNVIDELPHTGNHPEATIDLGTREMTYDGGTVKRYSGGGFVEDDDVEEIIEGAHIPDTIRTKLPVGSYIINAAAANIPEFKKELMNLGGEVIKDGFMPKFGRDYVDAMVGREEIYLNPNITKHNGRYLEQVNDHGKSIKRALGTGGLGIKGLK